VTLFSQSRTANGKPPTPLPSTAGSSPCLNGLPNVISSMLRSGSRGDSRLCPRPWCRSGYPEQRWPLDQAATVGRVTMGASLRGAMVSRLMAVAPAGRSAASYTITRDTTPCVASANVARLCSTPNKDPFCRNSPLLKTIKEMILIQWLPVFRRTF
jgi:hypothetical protein